MQQILLVHNCYTFVNVYKIALYANKFVVHTKKIKKKFNVVPVTCHQPQQPQPQTLPLLTSPLCTLGWFAKTDTFVLRKQHLYPQKIREKSVKTPQKRFLSFELLAIRSLTRSLQSTRFQVPADGTDYNQTYGHCNLLTESAQGPLQ